MMEELAKLLDSVQIILDQMQDLMEIMEMEE